MAKNTQRDRIWIEALNDDEFTKHDILERVDAGSRTVHDVLKTMVDAEFLSATGERRRVTRGESRMYTEVTVYKSVTETETEGETNEPDASDIDEEKMKEFKEEIGVSSGDVSAQPHGSRDDKPDSWASNTAESAESDESDPETHTHPDEAQLPPSQEEADEDIDDYPFERNAGDEIVFQHLPQVGSDRSEKLISAGFASFNELFFAEVGDIAEVDGFGIKTARQVKIYIAEMVRKRRKFAKTAIYGEYPEYIAREFNLDEEAAEKWAKHHITVVETLESMKNPSEADLRLAEKDLLSYLDIDDAITHYPGNPTEA